MGMTPNNYNIRQQKTMKKTRLYVGKNHESSARPSIQASVARRTALSEPSPLTSSHASEAEALLSQMWKRRQLLSGRKKMKLVEDTPLASTLSIALSLGSRPPLLSVNGRHSGRDDTLHSDVDQCHSSRPWNPLLSTRERDGVLGQP